MSFRSEGERDAQPLHRRNAGNPRITGTCIKRVRPLRGFDRIWGLRPPSLSAENMKVFHFQQKYEDSKKKIFHLQKQMEWINGGADALLIQKFTMLCGATFLYNEKQKFGKPIVSRETYSKEKHGKMLCEDCRVTGNFILKKKLAQSQKPVPESVNASSTTPSPEAIQ